MDQLVHFFSEPLVQTTLLSIITIIITQISKRFGVNSDVVAFGVSAVLALAAYLTINMVPQEVLASAAVHITAVYGAATGLYKLIKAFRNGRTQ